MGWRVAALAAALALPAAAQAAGSPDVAALQVALRAQGAYAGAVDGVLGPQTRTGVVRFQRRAGLATDGVVGPRTRQALGRLGRPRLGMRLLRRGAVGADVAALQFELAWHGAPSAGFDGCFGRHLEAAVRRFQRGTGLAVDGVAGPATLAALRRPPPRIGISLRRPIPAEVTDGFGPRGDEFHPGLDMPAPAGTTVIAAAAGRVRFAGWSKGGYGLLVVLAHAGGLRTMYAHLSAISVRPGSVVAAGAPIGRVGSTGRATGPHLHFEARIHGLAVDPRPALL